MSPQTTISLAWQLGVIPEAHKAAVIQTLVDDVASRGYHLNVGIIGAKFLFPTLAEAGRGDVALMVAQGRTAPSYGYMIEQGATTLWETWESTRYAPGDSNPKGLGVPSWNHIMYGGGTSEFYFKHLAGIQQAAATAAGDGRGWERIVLKPAVWVPARNTSICANLSAATASVMTSRGLIAAAWQCASASSPGAVTPNPPGVTPAVSTDSLCVAGGGELGGNVVEAWDASRHDEIGTMHLKCTDGGTIKSTPFVSFGTPTGNCSSGFVRASSCDAKGAAAKVAAACVGKSSCSVTASSRLFGDPCLDHVKSLAVVATGCKGVTTSSARPAPGPKGTAALFTYNVTVPVGATAEVHLPAMGLANVHIAESGSALWSNGALVAGVDGVLAASANAAAGTVVVDVGSGSYGFAVHGA